MKMFRVTDLKDHREGHLLQDIMPGEFIYYGGLSFAKPGSRSHTNDGPGGIDYHVHDDCEAFIIVQGKGTMEVDKKFYPVTMGDIILIEPGEDHHLISSEDDPILTLWCHAGPLRKEEHDALKNK